ncbi:MAG: hypothetical protein HY360_21440 [Verrucomicrobia bacterium]|nr:hypothetical protein [Verrucomicrobiota bacterium]
MSDQLSVGKCRRLLPLALLVGAYLCALTWHYRVTRALLTMTSTTPTSVPLP